MQNVISKLAASKVLPTTEAETSLLLVPKHEVKPAETSLLLVPKHEDKPAENSLLLVPKHEVKPVEKTEISVEKETSFKPKLDKKKKSEAPKKKKVKVKQNARDAYNKHGADVLQPKNKIVY